MSEKKRVVVLGAGISGLSVGYFLARSGRYEVTVIEKALDIGGVCGSFKHNGFVLDYGPHKLYSIIPGILGEIKSLMDGQLLKVAKKNRIFLRGHLLDYPLQLGNLAKVLGIKIFFKLGFGYAVTFLSGLFNKNIPCSYEEYIVKRFGRGAYELVFEPLADKVWGNPSTLHPDMARARVPASGGMDVILRLLGIKKESKETSAKYFYYPKMGLGDFPQTLKLKIEEKGGMVLVNANTVNMKKADGKITSVDAAIDNQIYTFQCDYVISSIPLSSLGKLILSDANNEISHAVQELEFRHVILVYVFINKPLVLEDQWIFFPERDFIFSRIFEQKQMNHDLGPSDKTVICCDFTCTEESWQWKASDEELAKKCVEDLVKGGFIQSKDVFDHLVIRIRNFYPRYALKYKKKIDKVYQNLQQFNNLLLTGRIGMYNYNNSDHCFDMGKFIAERLEMGKGTKEIWKELQERVENYKIID